MHRRQISPPVLSESKQINPSPLPRSYSNYFCKVLINSFNDGSPSRRVQSKLLYHYDSVYLH